MDQSVYLEKNISQQPALDLLQSMGYTYCLLYTSDAADD